jgi:hypothetical protein
MDQWLRMLGEARRSSQRSSDRPGGYLGVGGCDPVAARSIAGRRSIGPDASAGMGEEHGRYGAIDNWGVMGLLGHRP